MTNPSITYVNGETGEEIIREMNEQEYAEHLAIIEAAQLAKSERELLENKKSVERAALLAKLGITSDEAALLLG